MAIKCRGDHVLGGLYTGINTRHIVMTSKMVQFLKNIYILKKVKEFVDCHIRSLITGGLFFSG